MIYTLSVVHYQLISRGDSSPGREVSPRLAYLKRMNTSQLFKVTAVWISVVYIVCFGGVALFPGIREAFMKYALHTDITTGSDIMTLTTFISGLIIWNVIAIVAVWLYIALRNYFIKQNV